ncbi:hypothetical protein BDV93DRAFT_542929 [Ceratobasidium sp. AG-I]|nr:hypothetical protein BDV93DRAFT_542929 [Ceratobasidium sp. AG-I]
MNTSASVNSLHPEILAYIFSIVVHTNFVPNADIFDIFYPDFEILGFSSKQASLGHAVMLSSVCKHWRNVALNSRTLWVHISILLTNEHIQRTLNSAPFWLGRAQTAPLNIFIDSKKCQGIPLSVTALGNIFPVSPFGDKQIRTLYISLAATSYLNVILGNWFDNAAFNTLTHLHVDVQHETDGSMAVMDWLSQCQVLQALRLKVRTLYYNRILPMPSLVDLELCTHISTTATTAQLANILGAYPNLQQLKLGNIHFQNTAGVEIAPLQHLKSLGLQLLDATCVLPFLSSKATSVCLSITTKPPRIGISLLDSLIHFSKSSTITALHLTGLLRSLPQLHTLSLAYFYLDSPLALALRGTDAPGPGEETVSPTFSGPQAIWFTNCDIEEKEDLRLLVMDRSWKQVFASIYLVLCLRVLYAWLL